MARSEVELFQLQGYAPTTLDDGTALQVTAFGVEELQKAQKTQKPADADPEAAS